MDMPSNLPELLNTKVAERLYDDGVSPPAQELGSMGVDIVKAFRLFTAPLQLAAAYQDRLVAFCNKVRQQVPPERQVEAPPEVAGPVMSNLRFIDDHNPVRGLYFNLMTRAIDR